MGDGITIACRQCGYEDVCFLGVGMLYESIDAVLGFAVEPHNRKTIRKALAAHTPDEIDYSHNLYACPKCETIHKRFYVAMRRHGKLVYESSFKCGTCRAALIAIEPEDAGKYRCSRCGEKALEFIDDGMCWD